MEKGDSAVAEAVRALTYDSDFLGNKPYTKRIKIVSRRSVVVTGSAVASCWLDVPRQDTADADMKPNYYQVHIKLRRCDTVVAAGVVESDPDYKKRFDHRPLTEIHNSIISGEARALTGVFWQK